MQETSAITNHITARWTPCNFMGEKKKRKKKRETETEKDRQMQQWHMMPDVITYELDAVDAAVAHDARCDHIRA